MNWHRFTASTVDDSECTQPGCEVIVADEALASFAVGCPAPRCTAAGHEGEACVFVPSGTYRPVCAYCEQSGFDSDDDPDFPDDGEDLTAVGYALEELSGDPSRTGCDWR